MPALILTLTPEIRELVNKLKAYANEHRRTEHSAMLETVVPGENPNHVLWLDPLKLVYTVDAAEPGPNPRKWVRHLSVSAGIGKPPNRMQMLLACELLEMNPKDVGTMESDPDWVVHAIEPFEDPPDLTEN